ncbi:MAG: GNAT family N-acetyltransferase [Acidimicrobiia bacterium]
MARLERITEHHSVSSFRCGNADLDNWLAESALNSDRSGTARVYVWLDELGEANGYFAIAPHTLRRERLPPSVARGSPHAIPGYLLARLAVAESLQGRGNGGRLLVEALRTTLEAIRVGGGRVIVVDAIDDHAHNFYEHFGFKPIPETGGRLVMKASAAAASVGLAWP